MNVKCSGMQNIFCKSLILKLALQLDWKTIPPLVKGAIWYQSQIYPESASPFWKSGISPKNLQSSVFLEKIEQQNWWLGKHCKFSLFTRKIPLFKDHMLPWFSKLVSHSINQKHWLTSNKFLFTLSKTWQWTRGQR